MKKGVNREDKGLNTPKLYRLTDKWVLIFKGSRVHAFSEGEVMKKKGKFYSREYFGKYFLCGWEYSPGYLFHEKRLLMKIIPPRTKSGRSYSQILKRKTPGENSMGIIHYHVNSPVLKNVFQLKNDYICTNQHLIYHNAITRGLFKARPTILDEKYAYGEGNFIAFLKKSDFVVCNYHFLYKHHLFYNSNGNKYSVNHSNDYLIVNGKVFYKFKEVEDFPTSLTSPNTFMGKNYLFYQNTLFYLSSEVYEMPFVNKFIHVNKLYECSNNHDMFLIDYRVKDKYTRRTQSTGRTLETEKWVRKFVLFMNGRKVEFKYSHRKITKIMEVENKLIRWTPKVDISRMFCHEFNDYAMYLLMNNYYSTNEFGNLPRDVMMYCILPFMSQIDVYLQFTVDSIKENKKGRKYLLSKLRFNPRWKRRKEVFRGRRKNFRRRGRGRGRGGRRRKNWGYKKRGRGRGRRKRSYYP